MSVFLLDGKDMTSREVAFRKIKEVMGLPEYFGQNLDALYDCLSELPKETNIVIVNETNLRFNLESYGEKMLACFRDAAEECGFTLVEKD